MTKKTKTGEPAGYPAGTAGRFRSRRGQNAGVVTIKTIRQGLSAKVLKALALDLKMSERQLAAVLKIPDRTLDRRLKEGVLSPEESDRVARLAKVLERAREVFGNLEKARGWMNTRIAAFDGETPLERADTSLGASQVEDVLGRIDYGVFS
jgi:putative toxin-antitoxin system antitoxin component (TIGR02293 family)